MSYFFLLCMNVYVRYFILDQKEDTGGRRVREEAPSLFVLTSMLLVQTTKFFIFLEFFFQCFCCCREICCVLLCFALVTNHRKFNLVFVVM